MLKRIEKLWVGSRMAYLDMTLVAWRVLTVGHCGKWEEGGGGGGEGGRESARASEQARVSVRETLCMKARDWKRGTKRKGEQDRKQRKRWKEREKETD